MCSYPPDYALQSPGRDRSRSFGFPASAGTIGGQIHESNALCGLSSAEARTLLCVNTKVIQTLREKPDLGLFLISKRSEMGEECQFTGRAIAVHPSSGVSSLSPCRYGERQRAPLDPAREIPLRPARNLKRIHRL